MLWLRYHNKAGNYFLGNNFLILAYFNLLGLFKHIYYNRLISRAKAGYYD